MDEQYPDDEFIEPPVMVPSVTPERTFLEKLFLLHEEFQRPKEKIRVDRLSRHLYDIYQLAKTEFATNAIHDKGLYETIVSHRYVFTRLGGVDYNLHQPQTIRPIPPSDLEEAWQADYRTMQEQMIYGDSLPIKWDNDPYRPMDPVMGKGTLTGAFLWKGRKKKRVDISSDYPALSTP